MQRQTRPILLVFVAVGDPVADGYVKKVARPWWTASRAHRARPGERLAPARILVSSARVASSSFAADSFQARPLRSSMSHSARRRNLQSRHELARRQHVNAENEPDIAKANLNKPVAQNRVGLTWGVTRECVKRNGGTTAESADLLFGRRYKDNQPQPFCCLSFGEVSCCTHEVASLPEGRLATVLQLPAQPATSAEAEEQTRALRRLSRSFGASVEQTGRWPKSRRIRRRGVGRVHVPFQRT